MASRQARILTKAQFVTVRNLVINTRAPERNLAILLLSFRAGLRAKEIANLTWGMISDPEGNLCEALVLPDSASKGKGGGTIPIAKDLKQALHAWRAVSPAPSNRNRVVVTERLDETSPQMIVNLFRCWYQSLGFDGCSSHSGRRTFITNAARNIGRFGGSLRDVQTLARHRSLTMTQRYIEPCSDAMKRVVDA